MGNNLQMKRMVFLLAVCAALSGVWGAEVGHRLGVPWWKARLEEKETQAQTHHDTVFIGDSITHNWDNLAPDLQKQYFGDVLNLGFSGDRTHEVLWRIRRIDWAKVAPKRIMLMIGTNRRHECRAGGDLRGHSRHCRPPKGRVPGRHHHASQNLPARE